PAFTDADRPYQWGTWRRSTPQQWQRFLRAMFGQMRELLTNYGQIDLLWFDGGWERTPEEWQSAEFERMIRSLQPDVLINDRLPGFGDFKTPEQAVPPIAPPQAWETCLTINHSWATILATNTLSPRARWCIRCAKSPARAAICCSMSARWATGSFPPSSSNGSRRSQPGWVATARASPAPGPAWSRGSSMAPRPAARIAFTFTF